MFAPKSEICGFATLVPARQRCRRCSVEAMIAPCSRRTSATSTVAKRSTTEQAAAAPHEPFVCLPVGRRRHLGDQPEHRAKKRRAVRPIRRHVDHECCPREPPKAGRPQIKGIPGSSKRASVPRCRSSTSPCSTCMAAANSPRSRCNGRYDATMHPAEQPHRSGRNVAQRGRVPGSPGP